MYRFKDKRPQRRSAQHSSSETSSPGQLPPSPTRRCIEWPSFPRRMVRLRTRLCLLFVFIVLVGLFFRYQAALRFTSRASNAQRECDFPLGTHLPGRSNEFSNTFASYKHFGEKCNISSLELHHPYEPICANRVSMLMAMSSGGRIGRDAAYIPRGCAMQWYTTEEVCEILGRFSQVIIVGDSMLRHVIGALNVIVRQDLGYGGVTDWNFDARER